MRFSIKSAFEVRLSVLELELKEVLFSLILTIPLVVFDVNFLCDDLNHFLKLPLRFAAAAAVVFNIRDESSDSAKFEFIAVLVD